MRWTKPPPGVKTNTNTPLDPRIPGQLSFFVTDAAFISVLGRIDMQQEWLPNALFASVKDCLFLGASRAAGSLRSNNDHCFGFLTLTVHYKTVHNFIKI